MKAKLLICTFLIAYLNHTALAQSIVGTWKRTSTVLVDKDNVSTDLQQMMTERMPCASRVTYTFLASGLQKTSIPKDCEKAMAAMAAMYADAKYELKGNKLKVFSPQKELFPDAVYDVSFQGNTMTWTYDYTANPATPNPTHAKKITIIHQKI
jgi:hypothetical protein